MVVNLIGAIPNALGQGLGPLQARPPIHVKEEDLPPAGFVRPPLYVKGAFPSASATPPAGAFTPAMIKTFYGQPYSSGTGTTIAIVDAYDNPNAYSDLQTFINQFGLPSMPTCGTSNGNPVLTGGCFAKIPAAGAALPFADQGWALEISLDVQWAHAVAPGANIVLIEAASASFSDLLAAVDKAVALGANVVSMSWGGREFRGETSLDSHFCNKATVFFASSGDSGHGAEYPSASPCVISVGGTTASTDSSGTYVGETAWSGSGGGASRYEPLPAAQAQSPYVGSLWGKMRATPDVAYIADPNTGFAVYDSYGYNGQAGWFQLGGTSAGSPQWAALFATSLRSTWSGNLSLVYKAANSYGSNFHDITSGSNGTCGTSCTAVTNFDLVTGLGSPRSSSIATYLHIN
jgi:subtilase family serine protease